MIWISGLKSCSRSRTVIDALATVTGAAMFKMSRLSRRIGASFIQLQVNEGEKAEHDDEVDQVADKFEAH